MSSSKDAFRKRVKSEVENRNSGGNKFSALNLSSIEAEAFKPSKEKNETNRIDIVPFFTVKKWVKDLRGYGGKLLGIKKGDMLYKLEVPQHPNVGEEGRTILCRRAFIGKSCPICEEREALKESGDGDEDEIKALYPKTRVFYNVYDYNERKKEKRWKFWDASYHSFEKFFLEEADQGSDGIVIFADPTEGKTIKFKGRTKTFPGGKFIEAKNIEFVDRDKKYSDELIIKKAIPFDKFVVIPTYEEVQKMNSKEPELEEEDKKQTKKKKKKIVIPF